MGETLPEQNFKIVGITGWNRKNSQGLTPRVTSENQVYLPWGDASKLLGLSHKKWPRSPLASKRSENRCPLEASQKLGSGLAVSPFGPKIAEYFDQMKSPSQTLEGLSTDHMMIVSRWQGAGALSLLQSLDRSGSTKSGSSYPLEETKDGSLEQFLLEVVLVSLCSGDPSLSHQADGQPSFLRAIVRQTGNLEPQTCSTVPQGLSLGIACASLLCLILLSLGITVWSLAAKTPKILTKMS